MKNPKIFPVLALFILFLTVVNAHAQLAGNNIPGDFGVKSGSQAPPGIYAGYLLYNYDTSRIVRNNGGEVKLTNGDISAWAHAPIFSVVTTKKILGANYGALIIPSFTNLSIEAPRAGLQSGTGYGSGDLYMQPVNLGWQTKHADVLTWYGIFAPTGEYSPGGQFNLGKGMWGHELALGSTAYLNEKKTVNVSALGTYEIHTKKQNTDVKVGQMLTIEGGAGATAKQADSAPLN